MPRGLVATARSGGHCPLRVSGGILCSERGQSHDAFQAIPLEETSPRCNKLSEYVVSSSSFLLYARLQTGRYFMVWWCPSVLPSDSPSVRPSDSPSGSPSASFPHFSPTCFDTLSWNFAYDFVLMYYRSSSSVINLRQSLWELPGMPLLELRKLKMHSFPALFSNRLWQNYWAEILHMTLFYCTTDQVRVSSICVNFYGSYAPIGT